MLKFKIFVNVKNTEEIYVPYEESFVPKHKNSKKDRLKGNFWSSFQHSDVSFEWVK